MAADPQAVDDRFITVKEAAKMLGLTYADVDRRMKSGDIAYTRYAITGASRAAVRLRLSDVIAYRDRCHVPARKTA